MMKTNRFTQAELETMLTFLYKLWKANEPPTHIADLNNPHQTTAAQVGAATPADLLGHTSRLDNPHQVTAAQLGLDPHTIEGHIGDLDNPHQTTAAQTGADPSGTAATAVSGHEAAGNPHPQYATDTDLANHMSDTSTHGVGLLVGADEAQTLANKRLDATNKYGGTTDYSAFEADGTLVANGAATTFDDSQAAVIYMRPGGTALTLVALSGGVYAYRFDPDDEVHSQIQTTHRYKLGSPIGLHIHLINKNAIGATNYNVGVQLEWCWAGLNQVMPAATTEATVDCSFQNASALTHKVFELKEITPTAAQNSISSILFFRVKRVTATTQNYAANDIFIAGIDFHNEMDTQGSRQEYIK